MQYTSLFRLRRRLYQVAEKVMETAGIERAYIPTISHTVTPESYTDFLQAVASHDPAESYYLQPSPEFYLKRLIAQEQQSFYYLGPVYRAGEPSQSPLHLPEFDMLEFYKIGCDYAGFIELSQTFFRAVWQEFPDDYSLHSKSFAKEIVVAHWADLFAHIGIHFDQLRSSVANGKQSQLRSYLTSQDDLETCFYKIFYQEIEHQILDGRLWFLSHYPEELGALAQRCDDKTSQRFEVFWGGIELMNSYGESNDAVFMRRLMEHENAVRQQNGKPLVPIDEKFLDCLPQLPTPLSGGSIGLDRLLLILAGKQLSLQRIQELTILYW